MRHVDLSPSTQLLLVGLLSVALAAILMRAAVFIRCEYAGIRPLYPSAWSAAQCRVLECFRLLVGISLIPLWEFFLFIAPSMPTNSPFGYLEMISLIVLVLFSHAWVLLLAPRNWNKRSGFSRSFWLTISFLVIFRVSIFAATGWILANASASPPRLMLPVDVYAALEVQPIYVGTNSLSSDQHRVFRVSSHVAAVFVSAM